MRYLPRSGLGIVETAYVEIEIYYYRVAVKVL